ncbi:MAG: hypothetical protein GY765_11140 [bacterium]|nr:hypothetical protein [bacterium]
MISVIVCSRQVPSWQGHGHHITVGAGCECQYLRLDNREKPAGICSVYNRGAAAASGDILVFIHEDAFFLTPSWGAVVEKKFSQDASLGLLGVAGTQYLLAENPAWPAAGRPFIHGRVVHNEAPGKPPVLSLFSKGEADTEVVAVDGFFMAVRASLFDTISFDEKTFGKFHFYDLDICMQVRRTHRVVVTTDLLMKHLSGGSFDKQWVHEAVKFIEKYRDVLPASCVTTRPDPKRHINFETLDLKQVVHPGAYEAISKVGADYPR